MAGKKISPRAPTAGGASKKGDLAAARVTKKQIAKKQIAKKQIAKKQAAR